MSRLLKTAQVPGRRPLRRRQGTGRLREGRGEGRAARARRRGEERAGGPGPQGAGRRRCGHRVHSARRGAAVPVVGAAGSGQFPGQRACRGPATLCDAPTHPGKKGAPAAARRPAEGAPRPARAGHGPQGPFPQRTARGARSRAGGPAAPRPQPPWRGSTGLGASWAHGRPAAGK